MPDFSLYVILDEKYIRDRNLTSTIIELAQGGATIIQLREKSKNTKEFLQDAIKVKEVTRKFGIPFIVNDRIDVAIAVDADGVHLGEDDMPISYARKILGNRIIGSSIRSVAQALEAANSGATYLAVGCLFQSSTASKPIVPLTLISEIKKAVRIPVVGIGGITIDRIADVLAAGADGICVAGDLFNYPNLRDRTYEFKLKIQKKIKKC
ncbi:MAG: thiamine phosphate synthase [bacterium]|nr:thiamine phosphate synthase [bacterium]